MTLRVGFIPWLPSQMQPDTTINLNAAVTNDSTQAGVDWQVCASGCGYFTIKPAVPAIAATATTPYIPPVPAMTTTIVSAWPNGLPILYTAPSQTPSSGVVSVVASAHADTTTAISGTIAVSPVVGGPTLNGIIQAGVAASGGHFGCPVCRWKRCYGSASSLVASAVPTDKSGAFSVPSGYACPQPDGQAFLVATGGKVGSNSANPNLAFMTALGSCSEPSSSTIVLNEITTSVSASALAPFAPDPLTGNKAYEYIGTSSGNLTGLANAFATVNNLVDISTGKVRFTVPAGNASVPYVEINTLADGLDACAVTSGGVRGDGSACSHLFTATDVVNLGNAIVPTDTLQAAFNIAQQSCQQLWLCTGHDRSLWSGDAGFHIPTHSGCPTE